MLRKAIIFVFLLCLCMEGNHIFAQEHQDHVYSSVKEYLDNIAYLPVDSIIVRCNSLIEQGSTKDIRSKIAGTLFDYYSHTPVMGQEAVAVYIADNYFLNKKLKWANEDTFPMLYTYAEFNRESLIGMNAPAMEMENIEGEKISVGKIDSEYKIFYFYDSKCTECAKQTPVLADLLANYNKKESITLLAIYTGDNREEWTEYAAKYFSHISNPYVTVLNLWDPKAESMYHEKYSVLMTPTMFLVDWNNKIIGRKLDCNALKELLDIKEDFKSSMQTFLEQLFGSLEHVSEHDIANIANAFYLKTCGDSTLFTNTFYEIYKYLKSYPDYEFQKGAVYLAQIYMLDKPRYWSDEILKEASNAIDKFNLNPLGSKANDATLIDRHGKKRSMLSYKADHIVLFFNLVSCKECNSYEEQLMSISDACNDKKVKIISVYVGHDAKEWKKHIKNGNKKWIYLRDGGDISSLHDKYDIQYVPKVYLLEKDKKIIAKDIDIKTLAKLIDEL